jgi:hypothetical protein
MQSTTAIANTTATSNAKKEMVQSIYTEARNKYVCFLTNALKNTTTNSKRYLAINDELNKLYTAEIELLDSVK